jgi:N-methylhydantoinase B
VRRGSGGGGLHKGGDGLIREYQFLGPARVSLLSERRSHQPWGLQGGDSGEPGINTLNDEMLPGKVELQVAANDRLTISTAGGGGFGLFE